MNRVEFKAQAVVLTIAMLSLSMAAAAQQRKPNIAYAIPAGGKQGATFRIAVGGQFLTGASKVHVSGDGVSARVVEHAKPLNNKEFLLLRDQYRELTQRKLMVTKPETAKWMAKRAKERAAKKPAASPDKSGAKPAAKPAKATWTDADERTLAEVRKKLLNAPNRKGSPALSETVFIEVTIDPDATRGARELRIATRAGLTNPLAFRVGDLPEFSEASPPSTSQIDTFIRGRKDRQMVEKDPVVTLPAVLNGQIMPGDIDRFRFQARKGQRLVAAAEARELMPYLADAVPGWFEATLTLRDAKGRELAWGDRWRFHPDPVMCYEIPADGEYMLEVRDSIYRGRQDFVYRITLGELPFITSVFPLGHQAGRKAPIQLTGWNLPAKRIRTGARTQGPGTYLIGRGQWIEAANSAILAVDTLPECLEKPGNDSVHTAQELNLPIIVNGLIENPGDWDIFRFHAKADAEIVAEVLARRLDSPLDSVLKITDEAGKQLAYNDDAKQTNCDLETHHADSHIRFRVPADGTYCVHLGDIQAKGGREYAYRLRISKPRPDFELRVVPSSIAAQPNSHVPLTVHAVRRDGFTGPINVSIKNAKSKFSLDGAVVPAGADSVRMTLHAPREAAKHPINLAMQGTATIAGRTVTRPVVPSDDMMQAFIYRHLVAATDLKVTLMGGLRGNMASLAKPGRVRIPAGGSAKVKLDVPWTRWKKSKTARTSRILLTLDNPPAGVTIAEQSLTGKNPSITLAADAEKTKPGLGGNLIVNVFVERTVPASKGSKKMVKRRWQAGVLPAVPFDIVARKPH